MRRLATVLCLVATGALPAATQPLICFGNEPSWSIQFSTASTARVTLPGATAGDYRGNETRNQPLRERVWRGRAAGNDRELVLFLREAACSDGMSDEKHPVTARVSAPDGAFLVGCCRVPVQLGQTTPFEGTSWRLVSLPGETPQAIAAAVPFS